VVLLGLRVTALFIITDRKIEQRVYDTYIRLLHTAQKMGTLAVREVRPFHRFKANFMKVVGVYSYN